MRRFPGMALGLVLGPVLGPACPPLPAQAGTTEGEVGLGVGNGAPRLEVLEWLVGEPVAMPRNGRHGILLLVFCSAADRHTGKLLASLDRTQQQYQDAGVRIVVVPVQGEVEGAGADELRETVARLSLRVARDRDGATARLYLGKGKAVDRLPRAFLVNHLGLIAWVGHPGRGLYVPLQQALAVARDKELLARLRETQAVLSKAQVQRDHQRIEALTKELIGIGARHASPWITRFRAAVNYQKDAQKARKVAVAALKDLALRPDQMVHFANQCLLKDLDNLYHQQIALLALTPAAAQEPGNIAVQLAYARALAGCGNTKQAAAVARRIMPLVGDDPKQLQRYAEELTDTRRPQAFAKTALAAIDRAIQHQGASRERLMIKYRILDVGFGNREAAREVGRRILAGMRRNNGALNSFAWDLLTEEPYKGRFSSLALLATDAMEENGQDITYYMLDTIALAKFENGFIDEAIEYQKRAMAGGGKGDADYEGRMEMYRRARREREQAAREQAAREKAAREKAGRAPSKKKQ